MTSNGETGHSGELTDEQLDQLLDAVNEELLDHVRVTADPSRTLSAIMGSDQTKAALIIRMRVRARDLDRALDRARDLLGTFDTRDLRDLDRALDRARDLGRPFDPRDLDRALARGRGLRRPPAALARSIRVRALARAADLARAIEFLFTCGLIGDFEDTASRYALEDALARDLKHDRVRAIEHALKRALAFEGQRIWYHNRHYLADIERAFLKVGALERAIIAQPVDVGGADLSHLEIGDLDALDGVVWTRHTIWPRGIAGEVRKQSHEILDGVYRVGIGDTPDRHDLTRV